MTTEPTPWRRVALSWLVATALLAATAALLGRLGLALAGDLSMVAAFAPIAGVALAALVHRGSAAVPGLWLGHTAALLWAGASPGVAAAIAAGSTLSVMIATIWLRHAGFAPSLGSLRDLRLLTAAVLVCGLALSAANGSAWLMLGGAVSTLDLTRTWLGAWRGEALGALLVGVGMLAFERSAWKSAWAPSRRLGNAALATTLTLAAAIGTVLASQGRLAALPLLVVALVSLVWLTLRSGLVLSCAWTAAASLALAALIVAGVGPAAGLAASIGSAPLWAGLAAAQLLVLLTHALGMRSAAAARRSLVALECAELGVAEWSLAGEPGYTSQRWRSLLEDADGSGTSTIQSWLDRVHSDDRGDVRAALASLEGPESPSVRRQLRARVGEEWPWLELRVAVSERSPDGRPTRLVATLSDVQERRSAADRERLSTSLFQNLHEGLVIVDADSRILEVNPTYSRITGIARDELIGTVPTLLSSPSTDPITRQQHNAIWAGLRSLGLWSGEVVERRRNGDPCALHVSVFTVPDPNGAVRYRVLMVSDITEQRLQRERLERQAHFDELTRLPNRARLTQLLREAMVSSDREGHLLAVCYIDVDHFMSINERYGHPAGDRLLIELAARLRGALRAHASWSDVAARLGGDEFVLLLRADTVDEARLAVERVLRVISQPYHVDPRSEPVTLAASVGATVYPIDRADADTLLRHADHAMYGAKQEGRNRYAFFDAEHNRRAEERFVALGRVQEALDRHELRLYYQPKVDLKRGTVLGFEALLRWEHPDQGVVSPAHFLPLIENTGLSARVGDWVLAQALDQLERWRADGLDISVSVNVSARHLQEPDFVQRLGELLARHAQPLGRSLELEVLETAALADVEYTSTLLERCAGLGVRFALDDFGTGYSTLTYLKRLPVQALKIDRSFVHNRLEDAQDRAIVEGVIGLARTFSCSVVAEGVETPAQARVLLEMGCEVGQGAGIASPMPAVDVPRWTRQWKGLFAIAPATRPVPAAGSRLQ
jgi:diguanylate cyclase (GGDEF)-like protein/PAS domain S-box-containing protein